MGEAQPQSADAQHRPHTYERATHRRCCVRARFSRSCAFASFAFAPGRHGQRSAVPDYAHKSKHSPQLTRPQTHERSKHSFAASSSSSYYQRPHRKTSAMRTIPTILALVLAVALVPAPVAADDPNFQACDACINAQLKAGSSSRTCYQAGQPCNY